MFRSSPLIRTTIAACLMPLAVWAENNTVQTLHFAPGSYAETVSDTITGWNLRDYLVDAEAGQTMRVDLTSKMSAEFGIMDPNGPGKNDIGVDYEGTVTTVLPRTGTYMIRVYMRGDDADSGRTGPFTLTVTITN